MDKQYVNICKGKWILTEKTSQESILDRQILLATSKEERSKLLKKKSLIFRYIYEKTSTGFIKMICEVENKINCIATESDKTYETVLNNYPSKVYKKKTRLSL